MKVYSNNFTMMVNMKDIWEALNLQGNFYSWAHQKVYAKKYSMAVVDLSRGIDHAAVDAQSAFMMISDSRSLRRDLVSKELAEALETFSNPEQLELGLEQTVLTDYVGKANISHSGYITLGDDTYQIDIGYTDSNGKRRVWMKPISPKNGNSLISAELRAKYLDPLKKVFGGSNGVTVN